MNGYRYLLLAVFFLSTCLSTSSQSVRWERTSGPAAIGSDALAIDSAGTLYVACNTASGTNNGIFRSTDDGGTWKSLPPLPGDPESERIIRTMTVDAGNVLLVGAGDGVFRSTDGGTTWSRSNGIPGAYTIAASPAGYLLAASLYYIYRSIDHGMTWQVDSLKTPDAETGDAINAFTFTKGGSVLALMNYSGVYGSTDNGSTWSPSSNGIEGLAPFDGTGSFIVTAPSGEIYTAIVSRVYMSTDDGKSWTRRDSLPGVYITSMVATDRGDLFAATYWRGGIFQSTDRGQTWTQSAENLMPFMVEQLVVGPSGVIFAGTDSIGVLRTTAPVVAGVTRPDNMLLPSIGSITPNPTASTASMKIILSHASHVRAELIDPYGRRSELLSDGMMNEGEQVLPIVTGTLAQGIYFCRITVDDRSFVREVIVVR